MKQGGWKLGIFGLFGAFLVAGAVYVQNRPVRQNLPKREEEAPSAQPISIYHEMLAEEEEPTTEAGAEVIYYLLQSIEENLVLYEVDGAQRKEVRRLAFSESLYPEEDLSALRKGIRAGSLEEGVETMENFVS